MTAGVLDPHETLAGVRRSALTVLAIRVAGAVLAYGAQVTLARLMGRAEYGVFATVWVLIAILGHGSLWGVGQSVCRFVPAHRARGDLDLTRGFLAGGAAFTLASGLATALAGAGLLGLARDVLAEPYLWPLALALLVLPIFALQDYVEGVARSFNWTGLAIAPPYLLRQSLIIAAMLAAVLFGAPADPAVAIACTLAATALTLIVQTVLVLARLRRALPGGARRYRFREWARTSLPIALVDLATLGFSYVDVLLIGLFLPAEAVGGYFAATRILQFVAFVPYAASAATAQRFAEAFAREDRALLEALVARTARLACLATLAAAAAILAASPLLLSLFGPGFAASFWVLAILVGGIVVQSAFGPAEDLLTMLGAERLCAALSAACLGLAAAMIAGLVPKFGVEGAAAAMALATAVRAALLSAAVRLRLGLSSGVLALRPA